MGIAIALGSWFLHVGALALAPISLVQTTIAGGLVLLTVVADRLFGIEVTRRERDQLMRELGIEGDPEAE